MLMQANNAFDITVGGGVVGENKVLLFPQKVKSRAAAIECHERLGGLLRYYHRKAV